MAYYGFLFKSNLLKVYLTIIVSFIILYSNVAGMLTLSPMTVAPVCHVGGQLQNQLTCTASVQFIRWNILQVNEQGILEDVTASLQINSLDANQMTERVVNSSTFTFMRISAQRERPLISRLSIDSVSIGLNGTVARCSDVSNQSISASTTIQIIDINQITNKYTPVLRISEEYQANNITVTVKWAPAQQMDNNTIITLITTTVAVSPSVPIIGTGNTSRELVISYNTEYNFSVVAVTACGNAAATRKLNYVNCGYPELLITMSNHSLSSNDSESVPSVRADYPDLPIEGKMITFSCPPGWKLTGLDSATCTGNGKWEPDPTGLMCTGIDPNAQLTRQIIGIIVPIVVVLSIIAVVIIVVLRKKGYRVRKQYTQSAKGLPISLTNKYSMDKGHQNPQGRVVYADLDYDNPSEVKKKKPTGDPATPNSDVEYSLVNYNLNICYEDSHLEGQQKRDDSLDVTLNRLVVLLQEKVGRKWRDLGEAIDIDDVVLDSIAKTCFPENCIVEVLDYWLKYTDERITWREVAYVLKSINFHELALDVVQIYKTGKFPETNTRAIESPPEDSSNPSTEDKVPVSSTEKGSEETDSLSKLHQKSPKPPLPLPTKTE